MQTFKFTGPSPVDVPALGLVDVQPSQEVEVEDPAVSEGLHGQPDTWEHIPDPKRSAAAKKAAETRSNDDEES